MDDSIETWGTPGFFQMDILFQPMNGKFLTKVCPPPSQPSGTIREFVKYNRNKNSILKKIINKLHFATYGFLQVSSFDFLRQNSELDYEYNNSNKEIPYGFNLSQMVEKLEVLFKSMGMTESFGKLVYFIGHGSSSKNNTYYAGYDCGACSGRPGSVNAKLVALIANRKDIRKLLREKNINIPDDTVFIGVIRDTASDEIQFYMDAYLSNSLCELHEKFEKIFRKASLENSKERSYKFQNINSSNKLTKIHKAIVSRSKSLIVPVHEWNHSSNALCFVGRRKFNKNLYVARRSFLNSYDYRYDTDGTLLWKTLQALIPVCGGINLEYYFSRTDNSRMGAGSKLSHNVIGLLGVANGVDGDLRTGLPFQMIRIHEPFRILFVVDAPLSYLEKIIEKDDRIRSWIANGWIHLVCDDPLDKKFYRFKNGTFEIYKIDNVAIKEKDTLEDSANIYENDRQVLIW